MPHGYVIEFANTTTRPEFTAELDKMRNNDYIDPSTRAVIIYFTLYNYDIDKYYYCELVTVYAFTEFSSSSF